MCPCKTSVEAGSGPTEGGEAALRGGTLGVVVVEGVAKEVEVEVPKKAKAVVKPLEKARARLPFGAAPPAALKAALRETRP